MRVVVRRAWNGAAPFIWEVHGLAATPVHVSEDRYKSMGVAYEAGQARLAEFIPARRVCRRDMDDFAEPVLNHGSEMSVAL